MPNDDTFLCGDSDDWPVGDPDEERETFGCVFPGQCCMPGLHYPSECHTVEMIQDMEGEPNV